MPGATSSMNHVRRWDADAGSECGGAPPGLPAANKAVTLISWRETIDQAYPNRSSVEIVKQELFLDWSPDYRDYTALLQRLAGSNLARGGPGGHRNIAVIVRDPDTGEARSGVWSTILYGWLFID